jgi:DHA1 family multidrug resistance protein-like MFS transporter
VAAQPGCHVAGFGVAVPFLPLYVEELGVHGERAISTWAGLVFSTHAIAMAICGPIWGVLSDRYGRKLMVERAMFGGAVVLALTGCAQNTWQFMILRALWGGLTGTISAATTLVAASAPRERVGYALGTLQVAIYTGISAGPLLGGFVADAFGYRMTFWVTSRLLFLAGLIVLILVKEKFEPVAASTAGKAVADEEDKPVHQRIWQHLAPLSAPGLLASP